VRGARRRGRGAGVGAAHPPRERGEILRRAFEHIIANAEDLALLMTLEMGKPLAESKAEITYGAEFLRWFAEEAVRIDGRYAVAPNGQRRRRSRPPTPRNSDWSPTCIRETSSARFA
jgi:acyl-CoA reductase-like NAD-dependent aldehyde dehydrogenase